MTSAQGNEDSVSVMVRLGHTVRTLRTEAGLTMEGLASAAGVSRRVVSQLENGSSNPSLATIDRIANALGTDFARLMLPPREESLLVLPAESASLAWSSPRGSQASLLQSTRGAPPAELWEWFLAPGDRYEAEPDRPGSFELFRVIEGTLTIQVEGEITRPVEAGESARLASDRKYTYRNDSDGPLRFIRVVQLAPALPY